MLVERTVHIGDACLINDLPACFSCSVVSFEGSEFFSFFSVFLNFDLPNFSISPIPGLLDMVAEEVEAQELASPIFSVAATESWFYF